MLRFGTKPVIGKALSAAGHLGEPMLDRTGASIESEGYIPHPEVARLVRGLRRRPGPPPEERELSEARAFADAEARVQNRHRRSARTSELTLRGAAGPLDVRRYQPPRANRTDGLILYIHGGGWVWGSLTSADVTCCYLSRQTGTNVLSITYRLAPENPYPAAVDDVLAVYRQVVKLADDWGLDRDRIVVVGDSAGGNLATVLCLKLRDLHRADEWLDVPMPRLQVLYYPLVDVSKQHPSYDTFAHGWGLTKSTLKWFAEQYATPEQRLDPYVSPLLASDLSDLPPAYIGVAGFDPLRDEDIAYAQRLADAGVDVELSVDRGEIHGYVGFVDISHAARDAMEPSVEVLREALGYEPTT